MVGRGWQSVLLAVTLLHIAAATVQHDLSTTPVTVIDSSGHGIFNSTHKSENKTTDKTNGHGNSNSTVNNIKGFSTNSSISNSTHKSGNKSSEKTNSNGNSNNTGNNVKDISNNSSIDSSSSSSSSSSNNKSINLINSPDKYTGNGTRSINNSSKIFINNSSRKISNRSSNNKDDLSTGDGNRSFDGTMNISDNTSIINCTQLCHCHYSNRRAGYIVDCSFRNLTEIPSSIPEGTVSVNLRNNSITSLTKSSFVNWQTKSMQMLILSHNIISSIQKDTFQYFHHLWVIDLSQNILSDIDHVKFPNIHDLYLKGNPIHSNYESKLKAIGFQKYQVSGSDCGLIIYKRTIKFVNDTFGKNLENVDTILLDECIDFPKPTFAEMIFYGGLVVVFCALVLFLISQNYNHGWTKYIIKDKRRRSKYTAASRKPTVTIHVGPHRMSHQVPTTTTNRNTKSNNF